MPPRSFILLEANYQQLREYRPSVAVLPWGATEAHNFHLPHGTDIIEATTLAERAAQAAHDAGAKIIVLPPIPFGNNAQQLDQVATISLSTSTAAMLLQDIAGSLAKQGIDRLVLLNAHGGNEFKPLVRDIQASTGMLIVVINFFQMNPRLTSEIFSDGGDHAGDLETSFLLHVCPEWVQVSQAGEGRRIPFELKRLSAPGVWTPRPWSLCHPDTGSGDPRQASAEKGERYVRAIVEEIAAILIELARARKGQIPYVGESGSSLTK